jgi:hypothetical protein
MTRNWRMWVWKPARTTPWRTDWSKVVSVGTRGSEQLSPGFGSADGLTDFNHAAARKLLKQRRQQIEEICEI